MLKFRGNTARMSMRQARGGLPRRARALAARPAAVTAAGALALAVPAAASAGIAARPVHPAAQPGSALDALALRAMPAGTVRLGRDTAGQLTADVRLYGLTPGSSHAVELSVPGQPAVRFDTLTAAATGAASAVLHSTFTGPVSGGSRLFLRLGTGSGPLMRTTIAATGPLPAAGGGPFRLIARETGAGGRYWGTPRGGATLAWSAARHTLTVTVHAAGLTPGPHAAHIHLGSCRSQGPVKYSLGDLAAGGGGRIIRAVRVFRNVTAPIPAHGWYLNIHQGSSATIVSNGTPTAAFRPLLCGDIATMP